MSRPSSVALTAVVAANVELGEGVTIGPFAVVGSDDEDPVSIGDGASIEPFALVEPGVTIGARCLVDAYCRIASGSRIGDDTQVLYGAAVFERAVIGASCIIGGNVADRTVIEDFVTHFGEIAHDYRHPGDLKDWDEVESPSPVIRSRAVVGQNAILVGPITIGAGSYISAGEVVHVDVGPGLLYQRGKTASLRRLNGLVRARTDGQPK